MARTIAFTHARLGTHIRCALLDDLAPRSANFLWSLAGAGASFTANHAIWTGPEISIPLPATSLPASTDIAPVPAENATSFPRAGDLVLAWLAAGSTRALPPGDFFDIGLIYDDGARLLMPFGWIQANVAATILSEDLPLAAQMAQDIRRNGSIEMMINRA